MQARSAVARWTMAVVAMMGAIGCVDEPTSFPTAPGRAPALVNGPLNADIPAVAIDRPPVRRPWDDNIDALVSAIQAGGGIASIAVKEPGSARALRSGRRERLTQATFDAGVRLLQARGVKVLETLDRIGIIRAQVPLDAVAALHAHPLIDFIEPRQIARLQSQQTGWGISFVGATASWLTGTGSGATLLIIDTGHQQGHPDLPFVPTVNCAGAFGGCDDAAGGGLSHHGTHVLGIATARNNTEGVVGVAPGIADGDVFVYGACEGFTGNCATDQVAAGINFAIGKARVINLSLGGPYDAGQAVATAQAWNSDIVIIASAGNNGGNTLVYPAALPNVVGVSGVNANETFANPGATCTGSSNWGSHVDISAPFYALSTVPINAYGNDCGTSMAAPHVSGAALLLRAAHPTWTNQQVVDRLLSTASDRGAPGRDDLFGYGILDVRKAIGALVVSISGPSAPPKCSYQTWTASVTEGGDGTMSYEWLVRDVEYSNEWWPAPDAADAPSYTFPADYDFDLKVIVRQGSVAGESPELHVRPEGICIP
jgi:subtilisin